MVSLVEIRNLPTYCLYIRTELKFSRKTLAKYLGLRTVDICRIESGIILKEYLDSRVIRKLKVFKRYMPFLLKITKFIGGVVGIGVKLAHKLLWKYRWYKWRKNKLATKCDQLLIPEFNDYITIP